MFMLLQLLLELVTAVLCVAATVYVEPPFAERRMPARREAPSSTYEASTQTVAGLVAVDAAMAMRPSSPVLPVMPENFPAIRADDQLAPPLAVVQMSPRLPAVQLVAPGGTPPPAAGGARLAAQAST